MLKAFFGWLEKGAYAAVIRGVARAVADVTGGQVTVEDPPAIEGPEPVKRGRHKAA